MFPWFVLFMAMGTPPDQTASPLQSATLQNPGFEMPAESSGQIPGWNVSMERGSEDAIRVRTDGSQLKEGSNSLLIDSRKPVRVQVSQELFLPVGSTWRVTAWVKAHDLRPAEKSGDDTRTPQAGAFTIETPAGKQAGAVLPTGDFEWTQEKLEFRVPSPGRVSIALSARSAGKIWLDDVRLEPITIPQSSEVQISNTKLSEREIDVKQGGQFIEPLCHLIPSMMAQQVEDTSFEEQVPCEPTYKKGVDWPNRPWYPDGAVHDATYSFDTQNPYNGKRSQRIDLPVGRAKAGISQDGFSLAQGMAYKLHLHMRGSGNVKVWASLRGDGGLIAGPVALGMAEESWKGADALLRANKTIRNSTLTIEFEGPGSLWLDRISLIGEDSVLGLWRPDVIRALKAENPGMVRFGGSMIEVYDWDKSIGPMDRRVPYTTGPWGGEDPNFVGIEEFVQITRYVGAEPLICMRWSDKTPEDAAAEVEYMNGSTATKWGKLRAQNGHAAPYNVKYWQIGNEVGGSQYDDSVRAFAEAMRKADPSIKILSSFPSTDTLSEGGGYLEYLCPHHYEDGDLEGKKADFDFLQDQVATHGGGKDVRVAVTEWNSTAGEMGLTRGMLLTLGNALSNSRYQNLMHRYAGLVEIAIRSNLSDSFGSGMIQPSPGGLYLSPAYYAQTLYQRAAGSYPLQVNRSSENAWDLDDPDLSATLSQDGKTLRIFAVNSTAQAEAMNFHLEKFASLVTGGEVMVLKDRDNALDSEAMNSEDDAKRISTSSEAVHVKGNEFPFTFSPFSVTLLELRLSPAH
jgi:alpha-L-arabinofuranosidase